MRLNVAVQLVENSPHALHIGDGSEEGADARLTAANAFAGALVESLSGIDKLSYAGSRRHD